MSTQGQSCSDDSCSDDDSPKRKYREMLTRRPSYRKILNDLGGAEIAGWYFYIYFLCLQQSNLIHTLENENIKIVLFVILNAYFP